MRFAFLLLSSFVLFDCGSSSGPTLTDAACGTSVNAIAGDQIRVSLGSTYWSFQPTSDPSVLVQDGTTQIAPSGSCVPGGGCGTTTAIFDAVSAGTATIGASRTSCGEAMGCGPGQGDGVCTITVNVARKP